MVNYSIGLLSLQHTIYRMELIDCFILAVSRGNLAFYDDMKYRRVSMHVAVFSFSCLCFLPKNLCGYLASVYSPLPIYLRVFLCDLYTVRIPFFLIWRIELYFAKLMDGYFRTFYQVDWHLSAIDVTASNSFSRTCSIAPYPILCVNCIANNYTVYTITLPRGIQLTFQRRIVFAHIKDERALSLKFAIYTLYDFGWLWNSFILLKYKKLQLNCVGYDFKSTRFSERYKKNVICLKGTVRMWTLENSQIVWLSR